jgi:hypothetical protein
MTEGFINTYSREPRVGNPQKNVAESGARHLNIRGIAPEIGVVFLAPAAAIDNNGAAYKLADLVELLDQGGVNVVEAAAAVAGEFFTPEIFAV